MCEQIMNFGIGFPELVALHTAVLKKSNMDKLPVETAGYRVMKEIEDYNTLYDMKKQLYDLGMQILMMKQILGSQNKVMMTVLKLQCYYDCQKIKYCGYQNFLKCTTKKVGRSLTTWR